MICLCISVVLILDEWPPEEPRRTTSSVTANALQNLRKQLDGTETKRVQSPVTLPEAPTEPEGRQPERTQKQKQQLEEQLLATVNFTRQIIVVEEHHEGKWSDTST